MSWLPRAETVNESTIEPLVDGELVVRPVKNPSRHTVTIRGPLPPDLSRKLAEAQAVAIALRSAQARRRRKRQAKVRQ